jgi:hypothetical protein
MDPDDGERERGSWVTDESRGQEWKSIGRRLPGVNYETGWFRLWSP